MSGHSHWSSIKYKKGIEDAKRAKVFSKFSRLISIIAKEKGGDPETNASLRMAVEKARSFNMPQDNIEKAIKRGTGEIEGAVFESLLLEILGPANIAVLIEVLTDNKNRTLSEIRHLVESFGGKIATGGVLWRFEKKGAIILNLEESKIKNQEELELLAIEAGAEDIKIKDGFLEIYTQPQNFEKVKKTLEEKGLKIEEATLNFIPKEEINIKDKAKKQKIEKLFNALDEHSDVQEIYSNSPSTFDTGC